MSAALLCRDLTVRLGRSELLSDLNLVVPAQGLFGIVGPNGAGKSTLLKAVLNLLPLHSGSVSVAGQALASWCPADLARQIGYVPQHVHSHWDLTVQELLQLGLAEPTAQQVQAFGLESLLARRFNSLSGGEQARAAVLRALTHEPALLLTDEPAAHLDLPHQHRLMQLLRAHARERAVVIVMHDLHLAARYCDNVALLSSGRLLAQGSPADVLQGEALSLAYGGAITRVQAGSHPFFTTP
jgi:iron complex transport system ATP-binding protein